MHGFRQQAGHQLVRQLLKRLMDLHFDGHEVGGVGRQLLQPLLLPRVHSLADVGDKRGLFGNLGLIFSFLGLALFAKSGDKRGLLGDFCPVVGFVGLALLAEFGDKRRLTCNLALSGGKCRLTL